MHEKKLLRQRVKIRQTRRVTSLLGLLVLLARLSHAVREKAEEEARSASLQVQHFEENLDDNLDKIYSGSCRDLSLRRKNITRRAHGSKTKLKNFSVALSTMMTGIHRKKKKKHRFRRRNGSVFKRTQDRNLLSYQIWAMRKNGELSEENLGFPKGFMFDLEEHQPGGASTEHADTFFTEMLNSKTYIDYSGKERLKYIYNKLSGSQHFIKRNGLGSITQYESYFKDRVEQLLSVKHLGRVAGLRGYYNLIRLQKSDTVEICTSSRREGNVVDNIADIDALAQLHSGKQKSVKEFALKKARHFAKKHLRFEDCQKDSRGVLKVIDLCLQKIFKDLVRERITLFNFEALPQTPS